MNTRSELELEECQVHTLIVGRCLRLLSRDSGRKTFMKEAMLAEVHLGAMRQSIDWHYICSKLQHNNSGISIKVVPVNSRFFKDLKSWDWGRGEMTFEKRHVVVGHGKKTAGYAMVECVRTETSELVT